MSLKKKLVWLPYDFDTAIGINNEGSLVFDYSLEDVDTVDGAKVYNGQDSVVWNNVREAFGDELATMYKSLRSSGALSYDKVEGMFEDHQGKWCEAIFNEDAWFKYIDPLIEDNEGTYLAMAQGSKAEQRKWWLYNRFRYIDSKYNAGDALTDVINMRAYASSDITITPYADIYPTALFESYLVKERGARNTATTLRCPSGFSANDTVVNIYSASQLASVGDLSGLQIGYANFANATRLQSLKLGDSSSSYQNTHLNDLTLGNNVLLGTIDVRNCSALAQTVDLSGCTNIEHVYFGGTSVSGVTLPNGGILKTLQLPDTITSLVVRNQSSITSFSVENNDYSNITTLRIENCSSAIPVIDILNDIASNSRVRIIGFTTTVSSVSEVEDFYDHLDSMRGLDENGNNLDNAVASGTINGLDSITGEWLSEMNARYPDITITYNHISSTLTYKTWDGSSTIATVACLDGIPQSSSPSVPSRTSTAQYDFTGVGWNLEMDASENDASCITNVTANRTVYAAYSRVVRTYTVIWKNTNGTVLETDSNVPYGTVPTYNSATPTYDGETSTGWTPEVAAITGDTIYTAIYVPVYTVTFVRSSDDGGGTLATIRVQEGNTPVYNGETPTTTQGDTTDFTFVGWTPTLAPIYANATYTAVFQDNRAATIQYLTRNITTYESATNTSVSEYAFYNATKLTNVKLPATSIEDYAFNGCTSLETIELSSTSNVTIKGYAFYGCSKLNALIIRSAAMATLSNTSAFSNTAIARGEGAIYVPSNLVSTYKANSNWSNYIIASIDDYPLTDYSTITDSWSEIIAAISNESYKTRYSIGDTKSITINGSTYYMQLVAKDTDVLADGSGTAATSWILKGLYGTHQMNTTSITTNGWVGTAMRDWLRDTVLLLIDEDVAAQIKPVTKTYYDFTTRSTLSTTDTIFIPSAREIFGGTSYEDSGIDYTAWFNSSNRRIKCDDSGSANSWWLRSAISGTNFRAVNSSGYVSGNGASGSYGVALGFCI